MGSMKLWARDGEAVRQAIELGEIAHIETASEEFTAAFLLFAIDSGLLQTRANAVPDPRREPAISMEVILPAHLAARFAGLYSMHKAGYVLRSARVLGVLGSSVEVIDPAHGLSGRGRPLPLWRQLDVLEVGKIPGDHAREHILRNILGIHGRLSEEPEHGDVGKFGELLVPDLPQ